MNNNFDIFSELVKPGSSLIVHNVTLVDVVPGDNGYERLIIKHNGLKKSLSGVRKWDKTFSRPLFDLVGYLTTAPIINGFPQGAAIFHRYEDQSLRRLPELDIHEHGRAEPVGWICGSKPCGFYAPVGLIPGEGGQFVRDNTVAITLRVPPEFVRECSRVQMSPEELLRSFVGDLAGISNYLSIPRADGYASNGSDEREYAQAWLDRAHGMNVIDLELLEAREQEELEQQDARDDFSALLDDFEHYGGNPADLFKAVQELIDKQRRLEHEPSSCGYTCSAYDQEADSRDQ